MAAKPTAAFIVTMTEEDSINYYVMTETHFREAEELDEEEFMEYMLEVSCECLHSLKELWDHLKEHNQFISEELNGSFY